MNVIWQGKLTKKALENAPAGAVAVITSIPPEVLHVNDPEEAWKEWGRTHASRNCLLCPSPGDAWETAQELSRKVEDYNRRVSQGLPSPMDVMLAYANPDKDAPASPEGAEAWTSGEHRVPLTQKVLMSLPEGARIQTSIISPAGSVLDEEVPAPAQRNALWLEIKGRRANGRLAIILVP